MTQTTDAAENTYKCEKCKRTFTGETQQLAANDKCRAHPSGKRFGLHVLTRED